MKGRLTRHPIFSFFFLAYAISWSIGVPLALQANGIVDLDLPLWLHYATAFGPALSALCMMWALRERLDGTRATRARPRTLTWSIIGFASPLVLFAVAQITGRTIGQPVPSWTALGHVNFLPDLGLFAWLLWLATSGTGEEVGWRGFLLPRLQRRHSPLRSSVLLALGWAGWHLPAFFYLPSYAAIGVKLVPAFFVGILSGALVLTWLYNRSGGSVVSAVLWHTSFNFVTASPSAAGLPAAVVSMFVIVWAVVLVIGPAFTPRNESGRALGAAA